MCLPSFSLSLSCVFPSSFSVSKWTLWTRSHWSASGWWQRPGDYCVGGDLYPYTVVSDPASWIKPFKRKRAGGCFLFAALTVDAAARNLDRELDQLKLISWAIVCYCCSSIRLSLPSIPLLFPSRSVFFFSFSRLGAAFQQLFPELNEAGASPIISYFNLPTERQMWKCWVSWWRPWSNGDLPRDKSNEKWIPKRRSWALRSRAIRFWWRHPSAASVASFVTKNISFWSGSDLYGQLCRVARSQIICTIRPDKKKTNKQKSRP